MRGDNMKSRFLMLVAAVTLFAALAMPVRLAAQQQNAQYHHYELIDIGTFGGPESFIIPTAEIGSHNPVNSKEQTVGTAGTTNSTSGSSNIICGGIEGGIPYVNQGFLLSDSSLANLGSLGGADSCSVATSINAAGEIAGSSENGTVDSILGLNELRGVRWRNMAIEDLGTLGGSHSMAAGINSSGQVVGFALNQTADAFSLFYLQIFGVGNGTQTRAVVWDKGNSIQDLGTLGTGNDAWGEFVNENGQVAGFSYTSPIPDPGTGLPPTHPFLFDPHVGKHGKMFDVGTLGGSSAGSEILNMQGGLNNRGHIVGGSYLAGDQDFHPFFWEKGKTIKDLGTLGGLCGTAAAINDADEVVGRADVSGPCGGLIPQSHLDANPSSQTISHAFLWKPGMKALQDLGTVAGDMNSYSTAINASGQVVGLSVTESLGIYRAFLWAKGRPMVDLNTLVPPNSSLYLNWAFDINDQGEISGISTPQGCDDFDLCGHAFLLIPCDEHHPGIEGCDYSMVDTGAAASVRPAMREVPANHGTGDNSALNMTGRMLDRFRTRMRGRDQVRFTASIASRSSNEKANYITDDELPLNLSGSCLWSNGKLTGECVGLGKNQSCQLARDVNNCPPGSQGNKFPKTLYCDYLGHYRRNVVDRIKQCNP
jgi:probable HAF family extracellular repeat protein